MSNVEVLNSRVEASPAASPSIFRYDIQLLRAIAVILVLVFHAFPSALPGGFIGVDVFFVISGFLITQQYLSLRKKQTTGHLRIFWMRRISRIVPIAAIVATLTFVIGSFLQPPQLTRETSYYFASSILHSINFALPFRNVDYFANSASDGGFQHFWTLALEVQFYFLWPIVLGLFFFRARLRAGLLTTLVAVLFVVPLGITILVTDSARPWSFFALPFRIWEFMAGAFICLVGVKCLRIITNVSSKLPPLVFWFSITIVVLWALAASEESQVPGFVTLVPVAATALALVAGSAVGEQRAVRARAVQNLGSWSYSIYLVHWPILVLSTQWVLYSAPSLTALPSVLCMLFSVPVAAILYRMVEVPGQRWLNNRFRNVPRKFNFTYLLVGCLVASIGVGIGAYIARDRDFGVTEGTVVSERARFPAFPHQIPYGLSPSVIGAGDSKPQVFVNGCMINITDTSIPSNCTFGKVDAEKSVALFGDSHAGHWFPALEGWANNNGYRIDVFLKGACPAAELSRTIAGRSYVECDHWRQNTINRINNSNYEVVFMGQASNKFEHMRGAISDPARWAEGTVQTLKALKTPVVVLADTPRFQTDVSWCLATNPHSVSSCGSPQSEVINEDISKAIRGATEKLDDTYLDLTDYLCADDFCGAIIGKTLMYADSEHLTQEFSSSFTPVLNELLAQRLPVVAQK